MCVKIHQFLARIKKDAHKRKLVSFFLPHGVVVVVVVKIMVVYIMPFISSEYWRWLIFVW